MSVRIFRILAVALLGIAAASCQKEPSASGLNNDNLVYTAYDEGTDFASFDTYFIPDSILLIGNTDKAEYWKDADAQQLIATVVDNLDARNYTRVEDKAAAQLGLQLSYVSRVTYYVGYNYPYWWGHYPYYWGPGYWGDWLGWYYPYPVLYGYRTGSLLVEMVNLEGDADAGSKQLPVVWDCFLGGLLTADDELNLQRTVDGLNQAFVQSPYLAQ